MKSKNMSVDLIVELQANDAMSEERIMGRRIHQPSGRSYHIRFCPPNIKGKDDITGEKLIRGVQDNITELN
jgi:adenylate kinase